MGLPAAGLAPHYPTPANAFQTALDRRRSDAPAVVHQAAATLWEPARPG